MAMASTTAEVAEKQAREHDEWADRNAEDFPAAAGEHRFIAAALRELAAFRENLGVAYTPRYAFSEGLRATVDEAMERIRTAQLATDAAACELEAGHG